MGGTATFSAKWRGDTEKHSVTVPMVTAIGITYNVTMAEFSTLLYGVDNNFAMDMGTGRVFTISCARVTPNDCKDALTDPAMWSNGKWWVEFQKFWDHWQNLSYETVNGDERVQGGADFIYQPVFDGYPKEIGTGDISPKIADTNPLMNRISSNVFLMGSMSPQFGVQRMTWSMQLFEARVFAEGDETDTVTFTFTAGGISVPYSYPKGSQAFLPSPTSAQSTKVGETGGAIVSEWESGGTRYGFGDLLIADKDMSFTAVTVEPVATYIRGTLSEYRNSAYPQIFVPEDCTNARIIIVGSGGLGGKKADGWPHPGGGGGSGYTKTYNVTGLNPGDEVTWQVGSPRSKSKGDTWVSIGSSFYAEAAEGGNGADGPKGSGQLDAAGGAGENDGGARRAEGQEARGRSGKGSVGEPGKGGEDKTNMVNGSTTTWYGGCGGGAADLEETIIIASCLDNIKDGANATGSVQFHWHGITKKAIFWRDCYNCEITKEKVDNGNKLNSDDKINLEYRVLKPGYFYIRIAVGRTDYAGVRYYEHDGIFKGTGTTFTIQSRGGDGGAYDKGDKGQVQIAEATSWTVTVNGETEVRCPSGQFGGGGGSTAFVNEGFSAAKHYMRGCGIGGNGLVVIQFYKEPPKKEST